MGLSYAFAGIVIFLAYLGYEVYQPFSSGDIMDEFKQTDLNSCSFVPEVKGCEDLKIHHPSGFAFIGCPEDYSLHKNYLSMGYNPRSSLVLSSVSYFYSYHLDTKKLIKLETKGFPKGVNFGVHGIDLLSDPNDSSLLHLFAVSHRGNGKDVVEHFTHKLGSSSVEYLESFESPDLMLINSLAVISPSSFYYTQDLSHHTGLFNFFENAGITRGGKVMFRDESGKYSEVARGLKFANGVALSSSKKLLYVVETLGANLHVFERDEEFSDITRKEVVPLKFRPDNINVDPFSGHIYVAGFPLSLKDSAKLVNYDGIEYTDTTASISARIRNETGEDRFFGRNYRVEPVVMDDGNTLFSTTTAASDEERGVLLLTGLFTSKGMMDCRFPLQ